MTHFRGAAWLVLSGFAVALIVSVVLHAAFPGANLSWLLWIAIPALCVGVVGTLVVGRNKGGDDSVHRKQGAIEAGIDAAPLPLVLMDARGVAVWANPAYRELTGVGDTQLAEGSVQPLRCGGPDSALDREVWATLEHGRVWQGERTVRRLKGDAVVEEASFAPLRNAAGEITGFVGVQQEISLRKQAEQELRDRNASLHEQLEARDHQFSAVNRDLELFAYAVSHDLRAPLRAIDFFARELSDHCNGSMDDVARGHLERMLSGRRRMLQIIDAMIALFHLGRGELRLGPVDLTRMAIEVFDEIRLPDAARAVDFAVQNGLQANADPRLLRAALAHLLSNAWKFTAHTPAARIEVGSILHEGGPAYFVRDNGAGFNMAYADRLFTTIRRLHTQEEYEGTGIGLVCVHRVVHRHHGRVWAESAEGRGATFFFTLGDPAAPHATAASVRAPTANQSPVPPCSPVAR